MGDVVFVKTREGTDWATGRKGVTLTTADIGTGMTKETKASMYKAFFTTKAENGTGLGLWISSEIVEQHHGRMTGRSSQADRLHGTVFALFLPF